MPTFRNLAVFTLSLTVLNASFARASETCPAQIILSGPQFINQQEFPTSQQVETNFNQTIRDSSGQAVWSPTDLTAAFALILALRETDSSGRLILHPLMQDQICGGELKGISYHVDLLGREERIQFDTEKDRSGALLSGGSNQALDFQVYLPSNCSGCGFTAELFRYRQVEFRP